MKLILHKKPKNVTIIEGFPGFGLIGTIATEFLMEHLKTEKIGIIEMDEVPAMIAIHQNKVIEPVSIHYNKDFYLLAKSRTDIYASVDYTRIVYVKIGADKFPGNLEVHAIFKKR